MPLFPPDGLPPSLVGQFPPTPRKGFWPPRLPFPPPPLPWPPPLPPPLPPPRPPPPPRLPPVPLPMTTSSAGYKRREIDHRTRDETGNISRSLDTSAGRLATAHARVLFRRRIFASRPGGRMPTSPIQVVKSRNQSKRERPRTYGPFEPKPASLNRFSRSGNIEA